MFYNGTKKIEKLYYDRAAPAAVRAGVLQFTTTFHRKHHGIMNGHS